MNRWRPVFALALTGLLGASAVARAQEVPVPVAPELLHGLTLQLDDQNCAVDAPAGWEWLSTSASEPNSLMFVCRDKTPGGAAIPITFQVDRRNYKPLDPASEEEFMRSLLAPLKNKGFQVDDVTHDRAGLPIADRSMHFAAKIQAKAAKLDFQGYVGVRRNLYCIFRVTRDGTSDADLKAVASSFRLLRKVDDWSPTRTITNIFVRALAIFMIPGLAIAFIVQRAGKKAAR